MNERKRSSAVFYAAIVVAVLMVYPLSFGPVCRLSEGGHIKGRTVWIAYRPILWMAYRAPSPISGVIWWWTGLFRADSSKNPALPFQLEWHALNPGVVAL
jgi:hypothetical protein